MRENQWRDPEISRRESTMCRVDAIRSEMSEAVRFLGGNGTAKEANRLAARAASLPQTTIERLRWKKMKRIPADIADAIREAVERRQEESLRRAKHDLFIARQTNERLAARLMELDADSYGQEAGQLRNSVQYGRRKTDFNGQ